jgi:hypothetical protein
MLISSRFWLYWVTSIPVTVVVIVVWGIWMRYQHRPSEESLGMMEAGVLKSGVSLEEKNSFIDEHESPFYPLVYGGENT